MRITGYYRNGFTGDRVALIGFYRPRPYSPRLFAEVETDRGGRRTIPLVVLDEDYRFIDEKF